MAKIDRYNGNLEAPASAALGTERTIFGTGSQSDDLTDQFNAFLLRGWGIVGPSDQPTLQDFNAMGFTLGQIHAYLHQMGVAEYNAAQEYHIGSIANVAGVLYVSLVNNNIGNIPASSPAQWSAQSDRGVIVLESSQSWTVPLAMQIGLIKPKVTTVGGGGGASRISAATGNGGGGGGTCGDVLDLTGVISVSVTIGAGGAGAVGADGAGTNGGATSFGAFLTAGGGGGGAAVNGRAGGGVAATGSIRVPGQNSSSSTGLGDGGSSTMGHGGRSGGISGPGTAGQAGYGYGAGGGGGSVGADGGSGTNGVVIIEW